MKTIHAVLLASLASMLPAQSPRLGLHLANLATPCEPTCAADLGSIPAAGGSVNIQLASHQGPFLLMVGGPFAPCQSIAGIGGLLSITPVSSVLMVPHSTFRVHVTPGVSLCATGGVEASLFIPAGLPRSAAYRLQAIAGSAAGGFAFSNPVLAVVL
jgi:hypothetical protein